MKGIMESLRCPHCGKDVEMAALLQCVQPIGAEDTDELMQGCVSRELRCMCPDCEGMMELYVAGDINYVMMEWTDVNKECHGEDLYREE